MAEAIAADGRIVIVGGGVGGAHACQQARRQGFSGSITLLSAEHEVPYDRPPLSKTVLAGTRDETRLPINYDALGIDVRTATTAQEIQTDRRMVVTEAEDVRYDGLVIATGAAAVTLPGDGRQFTLRPRQDALELRERLRPHARMSSSAPAGPVPRLLQPRWPEGVCVVWEASAAPWRRSSARKSRVAAELVARSPPAERSPSWASRTVWSISATARRSRQMWLWWELGCGRRRHGWKARDELHRGVVVDDRLQSNDRRRRGGRRRGMVVTPVAKENGSLTGMTRRGPATAVAALLWRTTTASTTRFRTSGVISSDTSFKMTSAITGRRRTRAPRRHIAEEAVGRPAGSRRAPQAPCSPLTTRQMSLRPASRLGRGSCPTSHGWPISARRSENCEGGYA